MRRTAVVLTRQGFGRTTDPGRYAVNGKMNHLEHQLRQGAIVPMGSLRLTHPTRLLATC